MEGMIKRTLDTDDNILDLVLDLWKECKKENVEPTQVLFGKRAFSLALKDKELSTLIYIDEEKKNNKNGSVGFFDRFELVTDYFNDGEVLSEDEIENGLGWAIEENTVAFNLGIKLQGVI